MPNSFGSTDKHLARCVLSIEEEDWAPERRHCRRVCGSSGWQLKAGMWNHEEV